jgi:hypothetical protein
MDKKELEKMFWQLVEWVRAQGCKVYCYKNKKTVGGSNGYFTPDPEPHIKVSLKNRPWTSALPLLIHEFCHFWQWKSGFLGRKDDEGNVIYSKILKGEEVTPEEREQASRLVRISEYDCEKRTAWLIKKWELEKICPVPEHIRSSNTYNRHAAWSIGSKQKEGSGVFFANYDKCSPALWGQKKPRWMSLKQVLSPISDKHAKIFDTALARHLKKSKKKRS